MGEKKQSRKKLVVLEFGEGRWEGLDGGLPEGALLEKVGDFFAGEVRLHFDEDFSAGFPFRRIAGPFASVVKEPQYVIDAALHCRSIMEPECLPSLPLQVAHLGPSSPREPLGDVLDAPL